MAFKGITFAGQNVTPKNDGGLYQAHYGDGILWGCSMAISGDDLVIQSGEFIMGGRVVQVDGATNVDLSGRLLSTGYIQVIMNADMSQGEGSQWYTSFVESATTTFPDLTKDDINDNGDLYQMQLAVVQISGGNLTSIYASMNRSYTVQYRADGDVAARLTPSNGGGRLEMVDSNGDYTMGVYGSKENDSLWLYSIGAGGLRFLPNGLASTSGEFDVLPNGDVKVSGQQIGGHTLRYNTDSASHNLPAYSWQRYAGVSLPTGMHLLISAVTCTGAGAGSALRLLNSFGTTSADSNATIHSDLAYGSGNGNTHRNMWIFNVVNPDTYYVWLDSQSATTISRVALYALQLT